MTLIYFLNTVQHSSHHQTTYYTYMYRVYTYSLNLHPEMHKISINTFAMKTKGI